MKEIDLNIQSENKRVKKYYSKYYKFYHNILFIITLIIALIFMLSTINMNAFIKIIFFIFGIFICSFLFYKNTIYVIKKTSVMKYLHLIILIVFSLIQIYITIKPPNTSNIQMQIKGLLGSIGGTSGITDLESTELLEGSDILDTSSTVVDIPNIPNLNELIQPKPFSNLNIFASFISVLWTYMYIKSIKINNKQFKYLSFFVPQIISFKANELELILSDRFNSRVKEKEIIYEISRLIEKGFLQNFFYDEESKTLFNLLANNKKIYEEIAKNSKSEELVQNQAKNTNKSKTRFSENGNLLIKVTCEKCGNEDEVEINSLPFCKNCGTPLL